jgi:hypothetical protein
MAAYETSPDNLAKLLWARGGCRQKGSRTCSAAKSPGGGCSCRCGALLPQLGVCLGCCWPRSFPTRFAQEGELRWRTTAKTAVQHPALLRPAHVLCGGVCTAHSVAHWTPVIVIMEPACLPVLARRSLSVCNENKLGHPHPS